MTPENDQEDEGIEYTPARNKKLVLDLNEAEVNLLRLKQYSDETDEETIKRVLNESLERDAIESALVKLIESLEALIVIQKRETRLRTGDYKETYKQIESLENTLVSVNELKRMLERAWKNY